MDYSRLGGPEGAARLFHRFRGAGLIPLDGGFYPVVHYPGITMYPRTGEEEVFEGYTPPSGGAVSVYAHIPFCSRYCNFCHYPVMPGAAEEEKDRYLAAISAETALYRRRLGLERPKATSVLVGGGTPTCLTPAQLARFLKDLTAQLYLSACTQFSYGVDPGTLLGAEGAERLRILRDRGVGRLTIGIQSFDDGVLKAMNRGHGAREALAAIEAARGAGFKLNLEFIYGYPGDTPETWGETMRRAAATGVAE
ncbi:MAG: radical SAM protein, partial [Elusimicrobiota bacterium]